MTTTSGSSRLPRVEEFPGASLLGDDIGLLFSLVAHHLERHVRALHDTWGVALGFEVDASGGSLSVGPGLAFDACGRPLLSAQRVSVAMPAGGAGTTLVVGSARPPRLSGSPGSVVRATDPRHPVRHGDEVELAEIAADGTVDATRRRRVRRVAANPIFTGRIPAAQVRAHGDALSWSAWIDTSSARFVATPVYVVTLGPSPLPLAGPYASVSGERPDGFVLTVRYAVADEAIVDVRLRSKPDATPVSVCWTALLPADASPLPEPPITGGVPCLP